MIRSFKSKEAEKIFNRSYSKKIPVKLQRIALRKLRMLNRAENLNDLRLPPGNRLEELKGNRKGQHSKRINDQWRICFEWHDTESYNVEIVDFH